MKFIKMLIVVVVVVAAGALVVANWSWVFSKNITGKVVDVERVTDPTAVFGRSSPEQMYSYSILLQGDDGKLYASSSEDRKWQVIKKGYCVEALLYRYPPWNLNKANTFFNAQMKEVKMCPGETSLPDTSQPVNPPPAAVPPAEAK